jgi:hypothetical protein
MVGRDNTKKGGNMLFNQRWNARVLRKPATLGTALVAAAGMAAGFAVTASASGGGNSTQVNFVTLSPAFKLETAKSMATNTSVSAIVLGTTTKIPTNATTVRLNVAVTNTTSGTLTTYPTGNLGGASPQVLSWTGGGSGNSGEVDVNVGLSNEVTFTLAGAAEKLTVTITGYSTQTTDGDISGLNGSGGQVITNNGTGGANWQTPSVAASGVTGGGAGQVLTSNGTNGSWQSPQGGPASANRNGGIFNLTNSFYTVVQTLPLAAGSYYVSYAGAVSNQSPSTDTVTCILRTSSTQLQEGQVLLAADTSTMLTLQGVVTATTATSISVVCADSINAARVGALDDVEQLVALQLTSASGGVSASALQPAGPAKPGLRKP